MMNKTFHKLNEADSGAYLEDAVNNLDDIKLEQMEELMQLETMKNTILEQEIKRLESKTHQPKIVEMKSRLEYNKRLFAALDLYVKAAKAETGSTTPDDTGETPPLIFSKIGGTVMDVNQKPIVAVTVSLESRGEDKIKFTSITDSEGNYLIELDKNQATSILTIPMLLIVLNKEGNILHEESEPIFIKPGESIQKDIIVRKK